MVVVWQDRRLQLMELMRVRIDRGITNPMGRAAVEERLAFDDDRCEGGEDGSFLM